MDSCWIHSFCAAPVPREWALLTPFSPAPKFSMGQRGGWEKRQMVAVLTHWALEMHENSGFGRNLLDQLGAQRVHCTCTIQPRGSVRTPLTSALDLPMAPAIGLFSTGRTFPFSTSCRKKTFQRMNCQPRTTVFPRDASPMPDPLPSARSLPAYAQIPFQITKFRLCSEKAHFHFCASIWVLFPCRM